MSRAWIFQDHRQEQKLGNKCPWSVGWIDPEGRRRSKKIGSKSLAQKHSRKLEGELASGFYQTEPRKKWTEFRSEYELKILSGIAAGTRRSTLEALDHFERIIKPIRLDRVKTQTIDDYVARRRTEPGKKKGDTVSPATINKELRHLKAVLNVAHDWEYLPTAPKIRMVKEAKKLVLYVSPDHFAAIYGACDEARLPRLNAEHLNAIDWWRALITMCYMTGWRISEPLALRRDDLDLKQGTAITRADDNKGKRDELVPLHSIVVEHLQKIVSFTDVVFQWPHHRRSLDTEFHRIQRAAGIHLHCHSDHEHTPTCHVYGFHDLRRAFATMNAETLSAEALQALMRHKSYQTTQRYINMARQLNRSVENLHVPEVFKRSKFA